MAEFGDLILDGLRIAGARDIVEIGAEFGGMTTRLADHVAASGGRLTSIDPAPKPEFAAWLATRPEVTHLARPSLAALPGLPTAADAWIVDGDHNWFTVYHELAAIHDACLSDRKPMLVFLHDVCWPCARRDFYYAPETIPEAYRHPYSHEGGVSLEWAGVRPNRGFRGAGQFAVALCERGPRNGVLGAVEDFIADAKAIMLLQYAALNIFR